MKPVQTPLLSVISVNYNNRSGLERTIKSLIGQGFSDLEYLVIDGGSTDGSVEIIEKYKGSMAYWVSEKDNGVYDAMNKGIRLSSGKYLLFLNSGDCFAHPDVLKKIQTELQKNYDILYGNVISGTAVIKYDRPLTVYNMLYLGVCHQAMFLKKELFEKVGYYDTAYKVTADSCHLLLCLTRLNATSLYLDVEISNIEPGGMSTMDTNKNHLEKRSFMQKELSAMASDYVLLHEYNLKNFTRRLGNFLRRKFPLQKKTL